MPDSEPFNRTEHADRPGVVGAKWWQEGLAHVDPVARRSALKMIIGGAIGVSAFGLILGNALGGNSGAANKDEGADDYRTDTHPAMTMQQEYGWNFGAAAEPLVFDGKAQIAFDRSALSDLKTDLLPAQTKYSPFFVHSLFDSPTAQRKTIPAGDPATFTPLSDVLVPIFTPAMDVAYRRGRALAALFDSHHPNTSKIAVIVDLPGPEAVAFAAGASSVLDPVFLFDNWPHPRGVVASHKTLAACAYYQPLFKARPERQLEWTRVHDAAPMFVLDRGRLSPYSDDAKQFDNRYTARVPSAAQMQKLGIEHVLYVTPTDADLELDDLNDDFVYTVRTGGDVKAVALTTFAGVSTPSLSSLSADAGQYDGGATYFYGNGPETNEWFWKDYPWSTPYVAKNGGKPPTEPSFPRSGKDYTPVARPSPFSSGAYSGSMAPMRPVTFGMVPVVVATATGVILGAKMSRSGSWTRSSSWGGG
jgi:hypothetical protein